MLQDAHIHLQDVEPAGERDAILSGAAAGRVGRFFCNAGSTEDWEAVAGLAERYQPVVPFFGIHPWYVKEAGDGWERRLRERLAKTRGGVGEIGLDKLRPRFADQERIFTAQVDMAILLGRPFAIHCVDAWGPLLEILRARDLTGARFMLHAFSGSADVLKVLLRLGAFFSFSARALISPSEKTLANIRLVPPAKLLLETDFPYLMAKDAPQTAAAYSGRIAAVYDAASAATNMERKRLERTVWDNGTVFTD